MKMVQESEKALLNGLTSEKRHLELSLKENVEIKEQYKNKCEELQEKYEVLQKEAQLYKRQIIGVDEIKRDRDTRINLLRQEIEELKTKLEKLEKVHASLTV